MAWREGLGQQRPARFGLGFASLDNEIEVAELPARREFPAWLSARWCAMGQRLRAAKHAFRHWFDGQAMPHRFSFAAGKVPYANRYVCTPSLRVVQRSQRSFMLTLDARSFAETARAEVPHGIPFGCHGALLCS